MVSLQCGRTGWTRWSSSITCPPPSLRSPNGRASRPNAWRRASTSCANRAIWFSSRLPTSTIPQGASGLRRRATCGLSSTSSNPMPSCNWATWATASRLFPSRVRSPRACWAICAAAAFPCSRAWATMTSTTSGGMPSACRRTSARACISSARNPGTSRTFPRRASGACSWIRSTLCESSATDSTGARCGGCGRSSARLRATGRCSSSPTCRHFPRSITGAMPSRMARASCERSNRTIGDIRNRCSHSSMATAMLTRCIGSRRFPSSPSGARSSRISPSASLPGRPRRRVSVARRPKTFGTLSW